MASFANRIGFLWEDNYPAIFAAANAIGTFAFGPHCFEYMVQNKWDVSAMYASIFNVAAVGTGFLFTFYTFVVTTDRGFIGRSKSSIYYGMMVQYTMLALWFGAALTIASIPMQMIVPAPVSYADHGLIFVAAWMALVGLALAAFYRSAYIFALFAAQHR